MSGGCNSIYIGSIQSEVNVIVILGSSISTLASIYAIRTTRGGTLGIVSLSSLITIVDDIIYSPIGLI